MKKKFFTFRNRAFGLLSIIDSSFQKSLIVRYCCNLPKHITAPKQNTVSQLGTFWLTSLLVGIVVTPTQLSDFSSTLPIPICPCSVSSLPLQLLSSPPLPV